MTNVAIVGGGAGGLILASKMAGEMYQEIRTGNLNITIFDGAENHEFQPGYIGVAFRGKKTSKIVRPLNELVCPGVNLVAENCSEVNLEEKYIVTEQTKKKFEFDYIIIATGSTPDYDQIPGLREENHDFHSNAAEAAETYRRISGIRSGKVVVGIAGLPHKCPPSPNESAFLLDEFFTKRGLRKDIEITMITPYLRAYPAEVISKIITPIYEERNINIVTGFNLDSVDGKKKELVSLEGDSMEYDELILVPPHTTVPLVKNSNFVDEDGWIVTDKRDMHIMDYDNAFSIGDNTNIPISKAGVEAHLQGIIVANNIMSDIRGGTEKYLFTGRTHCSMETGFHQATFVVGTYEHGVRSIKPSTMNYLQKRFMERIYWSSLQGGYEWLFKLFFGKDYMEKVSVTKGDQKITRSHSH